MEFNQETLMLIGIIGSFLLNIYLFFKRDIHGYNKQATESKTTENKLTAEDMKTMIEQVKSANAKLVNYDNNLTKETILKNRAITCIKEFIAVCKEGKDCGEVILAKYDFKNV